jgi:hypothetical protein
MIEPTLRSEPLLSPRALALIRQGRDPGQVTVRPDGTWEHPPLGDFAAVAAYYQRLLARPS